MSIESKILINKPKLNLSDDSNILELKRIKNREYGKKWRENNKVKIHLIQKNFYINNIKDNIEYKQHIKENIRKNKIKKFGDIAIKKRGRPRKVLINETNL